MSEPSEGPGRLRYVLGMLVFAAILLLSWKLRQSGGEPPAAAEQAVRAVLDTQVEAWNRGDLEGFMDGYWNDEQLTFFSGGDVREGWNATIERYRKSYQAEGKEMGQLEFPNVVVDVLSPDAALVRGRWQLTLKNGDQPGGLFTLLLRKKPEGWRIVHDHTSK